MSPRQPGVDPLATFPSPGAQYSASNEAQFRRLVETHVQEVASEAAKMILEAQDGSLKVGDYLQMFAALDAEENGDLVKLILRTVHDYGTQSANFDLDYSNGGTQKFTSGASLTIGDVVNLPTSSGSWINLRIDNSGGHTIGFSSTNFEGAILSFSDPTVVVSVVDFGEAKYAVVGGGF